LSGWQSPDPILNEYFLGGVVRGAHMPIHMSLYTFAANNSIRLRDPNGRDFWDFARGIRDQGAIEIGATVVAMATFDAASKRALSEGRVGDYVKMNVALVESSAKGTIQSVKDIPKFGDQFAEAVFAKNDYDAGRKAVKPVKTAVTAVLVGTGVAEAAPTQAEARALLADTRGSLGRVRPSSTEARSAANALRLEKQLASEAQLAEITAGGGNPIAGPGTRAPLRDEPRLIAQYGGKPGEWLKVSSSNYTASDATRFETHAYTNVRTGQVVEPKTKF
jgi:hypothetical protein